MSYTPPPGFVQMARGRIHGYLTSEAMFEAKYDLRTLLTWVYAQGAADACEVLTANPKLKLPPSSSR